MSCFMPRKLTYARKTKILNLKTSTILLIMLIVVNLFSVKSFISTFFIIFKFNKMSDSFSNIDSVTASLQKTHVSPNGVTFAGKSLKLDNEKDGNSLQAPSELHFTPYIFYS